MKSIRSLLYRLLGQKAYLSLVSKVYIRLVKAGFFRQKYPELFYLQQLIRPGFVCIDIGANVGYYSVPLSRYCEPGGKVLAVEPVPLFAAVFRKNTAGRQNIELLPFALGSENKKIRMETPVVDGVFRHGLTHVLEKDQPAAGETYEVEMRVPDELFAELTRLDYVKCDVEGYEVHLFPSLMATLSRFKPVIQIEITPVANRQAIIDLLTPLGYQPHGLDSGRLKKMETAEALAYEGGDFYFLT